MSPSKFVIVDRYVSHSFMSAAMKIGRFSSILCQTFGARLLKDCQSSVTRKEGTMIEKMARMLERMPSYSTCDDQETKAQGWEREVFHRDEMGTRAAESCRQREITLDLNSLLELSPSSSLPCLSLSLKIRHKQLASF